MFIIVCYLLPDSVRAEGSAQIGLNQPLVDYDTSGGLLLPINRPLFVDILSAGEVINISLCGDTNSDLVEVEIYNSFDTKLFDSGLIPANVLCDAPFDSPFPLNVPIQFITPAIDTYEIRLFNQSLEAIELRRVDVTVTPNELTPADPTLKQGRLFAKSWAFNAGNYGFAESANTDYYALVPGGRPGENFVWLLDLNNFAGYVYEIIANALGVDAPNSGLSTPFSGNSVTPLYPIYLGYPAVAGTRPTVPPEVANFSFTDNEDVDNSISPQTTINIQDSGTFKFSTDIDGTYAIAIDVNQDNSYGEGDTFLLGIAAPGDNLVEWDGRDNQGDVLPSGNYNAQLSVRVGEYHFIAADAETSGGGANNGLTIFEAFSNNSQADTLVYWDDATLLNGTTTLPNGQPSSSPGGKHTWGNFNGGGFGNERYIDTYVYGDITIASSSVIIDESDEPQTNNPNLLLVKRITAINPGTPEEIVFADFVDDLSTSNDNDPQWPSDDEDFLSTSNIYLRGVFEDVEIKPGDELEYTIYFLSNGEAAAQNVAICDAIPENTTFVKDAYGIELGISLGFDATAIPTVPNQNLSNLLRDDAGDFYPPKTAPPANLCKKFDANNNLVAIDELNNTNGAIVVRPAASLPAATASGEPANSYGFIRFRVQVQ
ncbi:MAG: hypothetical protein AAFR63_06015 [Cyanobacteria bacterium J06631_6]